MVVALQQEIIQMQVILHQIYYTNHTILNRRQHRQNYSERHLVQAALVQFQH